MIRILNKLVLLVVFLAAGCLVGCSSGANIDDAVYRESDVSGVTRDQRSGRTETQVEVSPEIRETVSAHELPPQQQSAVGGDEVRLVPDPREQDSDEPAEAVDGAFLGTLKASLKKQGLLSDNGRYHLQIFRFDIDQPLFGLDMTVVTRVGYVLTDGHTGSKVIDETIVASHTATVADALAGMTRLRLANEYSVRKNIAGLLEKLSALNIGENQISLEH